MRSGACLRVVLHAQQRHGAVAQAFQCLVIQIDVGQLNLVRVQRVRVDRVIVVLACNLDPARGKLLDRVVAAVVAEFQLERPAAERLPDELVAETDAEDRGPASKLPNRLIGIGERFGIAGAVGQEDTVGHERQHVLSRSARGHHRDAAALRAQHVQDVLLDAVIVGDHVEITLAVRLLLANPQRIFRTLFPLVTFPGADHAGRSASWS